MTREKNLQHKNMEGPKILTFKVGLALDKMHRNKVEESDVIIIEMPSGLVDTFNIDKIIEIVV